MILSKGENVDMTHKERQLAAVMRKGADRVSRDVIVIENGESILGRTDCDFFDRESSGYAQLLKVIDTDGRIVFGPGYLGELKEGHNEWGAPNVNDYGTTHEWPLSFVNSVSDLKDYKRPDPDNYDFSSCAKFAKKYSPEYAIRGPYCLSLFCTQNSLFGMEENMIKMISEPDVFEAVTEMIFEHHYRYLENYLKAMGDDLDFLYIGDDVGTQRGMMFSPAIWRKYFNDKYRKYCELGKKYGKKIWFHACGDITEILPDLIDCGIDIWETVQLHTLPISPKDLKREYGMDITFFGAVNTQSLPFKTPVQVREEALRCIDDLGSGGGYILGPDHHIKYDISAGNTMALFGAAE